METYKKIAQIPSLLDAQIIPKGDNNFVVLSNWTQRNLDSGKQTKFFETHLLSSELENLGNILPVDVSNEYVCKCKRYLIRYM